MILVEASGSAKYRVEIATNAKQSNIDTYDASYLDRWLDEIEASNSHDASPEPVRHRTWLESQKTKRGKPDDSGLAGVQARFAWKDEDPDVVITSPRRLLQKDINRMKRQARCVGMTLPLPDDAQIGRKFDFVCPSFVETMSSFDGPLEATKGTLTLDRVDQKLQRAIFSGEISHTAAMDDRGLVVKTDDRAKITIEFDLATKVPALIVIDGTARVTASGNVKALGTIKYQDRVTATAKTPAEAASLKAMPVHFRDNARKFGGVEFNVPSCWMVTEDTPNERFVMLDSRLADDVTMELRLRQDLVRVDAPNSEDRFAAPLLERDPAAKIGPATSPLGKGYAFEMTDAGRTIKGIAGPLGDSTFIIQIGSPPAVRRNAELDLDNVVASLKKAVKK